jgi:beta-glucanase (GH16 family)
MLARKPSFAFLIVLLSLLIGIGLTGPAARIYAAGPLVDNFEAGLPTGHDPNNIPVGFATFQDPRSSVAISTTDSPPAPVPGAPSPNHVLKLDVNVVSYAGLVHNFENAALNEWVSQDWSAYEGISFWLYGNNSGTTLFVDVLDNRNDPPATNDDAERWSIDLPDNVSGWHLVQIPFTSMHRKEIGNGAPNDGFGLTEVHGWALGAITTPSPQSYYVDDVSLYGVAPPRPLTAGFSAINYPVTEGNTANITVRLSRPPTSTVTVQFATAGGPAVANRDYLPTAGTLTFAPNVTQQSFSVTTIDNNKYQGERGVLLQLSNPTGGAALGLPPVARLNILDNEPYDASLLDDFETPPYLWTPGNQVVLTNPEIAAGDPRALPGQGAYEHVLQADRQHGNGVFSFGRTFPTGQDWSDSAGLTFWFYGQNSGKDVGVQLTNNQATFADPSNWRLAWSDEFNTAAGTAPNPNTWGHEVGDGTANGIPGWGNDELEYYTAATDNAATDGQGRLVITTKAADGSLQCYYGPCRYTSARLLTKQRFEVAYGRVEARIKVPRGSGLWPAFWMLGTDIDQVNWPQTGEIDIMEHVGRLPTQVFGTLHGPGYSGGQSYGRILDLGRPVADDYHTFAVQWQPDRIVWTVDGVPYFTATPNDAFLQGKQWVFNHPFFMLLNVAVGGNFGGPVGSDTVFPQKTLVDYVRIYQAPPQLTAFSAAFTDNFTGWRQITLPFSAFQGAPGQTLDRTRVQSVSFTLPGGLRAPVLLDQLRLLCSSDVTVTTTADSGPGSLRNALRSVCTGGTIHFAPALAGQTITNLSDLTLGKNVTIDGSAAAGLTISGNHAHRVLVVNAGTVATVKALTLADGYGFQVAGGVLNNGTLTLDHVRVTGNQMTTNAGDFWQGGGGIYTGDGATLNLIDSTVADNTAQWSGGGLYSFFNSHTTVLRSTISGNVSNDVGGAIRSLGIFTIENSTISGNRSTGWHGGAIFHTDGAMAIANSTIVNNIGPDWAPSAIFLGSFSAAQPTLSLVNTIIHGNHWYACEQHAAGTVHLTSGGHNLVQDDSCSPVASDLLVAGDVHLGPLAASGGPTWTHALLAGSPAIDAADPAASPATDQRGVTRPQGTGPDIGAYEAP